MSYDPTNENEALDPIAAAGDPAASSGTPPSPPPPADPLFDAPGDAAAPAARRASTTGGVDRKTLIGAGIGAAVIALGAVVGINLASSGAENGTNTAGAGPMGMTGGPGGQGQMPGGPQGGTTNGQSQGQSQGQGQGQGQAPGGMQGGPGGSTGTIDSIGDGTLTVSTDSGDSVEVTTTDDTEVSISESGSADDIDEGDTVLVIGQSSDDSTVTAERVVEREGDATDDPGGPGGPGGGRGPVSGEVSSVDGDQFVVSTDAGDITVTMTDDTTVVVERSASVSDLSEGDEVVVHTHEADDGSAWAERIIAGDALPDAGMGGRPAGMQGDPSSGGTGSAPSGQSGTMAPPDQGGTGSGSSGSSGTTGGAPGANAGPGGVTTT